MQQHHHHNTSEGHVCGACRWPFPNPHPSAKQRRAHRKHCGRVDGYPLVGAGPGGGDASDDDDAAGSGHHRQTHAGDDVRSCGRVEIAEGHVETGQEEDALKPSDSDPSQAHGSGKTLEIVDGSHCKMTLISEAGSAVEHSGSKSQLLNSTNSVDDLLLKNSRFDLVISERNDCGQDPGSNQLFHLNALAEKLLVHAEHNAVGSSEAASVIIIDEVINGKNAPAAVSIPGTDFPQPDNLQSTSIDIKPSFTLHYNSDEPEAKSHFMHEEKSGYEQQEPVKEQSSLSLGLAADNHNTDTSRRQDDDFEPVDAVPTFISAEAGTSKRQEVQSEENQLNVMFAKCDIQPELPEFGKNQSEVMFAKPQTYVGVPEPKSDVMHEEKDGFAEQESSKEQFSLPVELGTDDHECFKSRKKACLFSEPVVANGSCTFSSMETSKSQDDDVEAVDADATSTYAGSEIFNSQEAPSEIPDLENNKLGTMFVEPQNVVGVAHSTLLALKGDKLPQETENSYEIKSNGVSHAVDNGHAIVDSSENVLKLDVASENFTSENMPASSKEVPQEEKITSNDLVSPSVLINTLEEVVSSLTLKTENTSQLKKEEEYSDYNVDIQAAEEVNMESHSQDVCHSSLGIDFNDIVHCVGVKVKDACCHTGAKTTAECSSGLVPKSFKDHSCSEPEKKEPIIPTGPLSIIKYSIEPSDVEAHVDEGKKVDDINLESMCHDSVENDCSEENKRASSQAEPYTSPELTSSLKAGAKILEEIHLEEFQRNSKPAVSGLVIASGLEGNALTEDTQINKTISESNILEWPLMDSLSVLHNQVDDPLGSTVSIQQSSQESQANNTAEELEERAIGTSSNQPPEEEDVTTNTQDADALAAEDEYDIVKFQNSDALAAPDTSVDSISQTDSTECHWGSVSGRVVPPVKALKELQVGGSVVEAGTADIDPEKNSASVEIQPTSMDHDAKGRKKNEELIAKVVSWSAGKPHTPLKNLLLETNNAQVVSPDAQGKTVSPPSDRRPSPDQSHAPKTHIPTKSLEKPTQPAAKNLVQKEWNSPARLPSAKNAKGKTRGKPQWVPFMCCSSVN